MWEHNHTPSVFAKDPYFKGASATQSKSQTQVVERKRAAGEEIGTIHNLSNKPQSIINVRQFTIYSKAGKVL